MSALTIEGITEDIKTRTATYRNDPPILLSGYNQEKQTVQDYEGRQLLELMQNADDAKSDILRIKLDTANGKLSVQNNGDAFSLEGIKSLMFTGNSSKNKEEFIGNKGLGFRSILNWVHSVSIYTQTVSFRFSESHSQAYYREHIASSEKVRQMIHDEVKAKKLQADELPIAALAFPEIIDNLNDQGTVTNIVLDIKKEEIDAIKKQIFEIREEILLFLPNIKRLIVEIDGELQIDFEKTKEDENLISINDSQWNIYRSETKTWNDGKKDHKYKFAIAWKDDLQTNGMFYNYFPTDVATYLPCIIHATFDLTNNRKEINETNANKHILEEIVKSLGEIADQRLKKANADWQAYEFLTPTSKNNRKVLKDFYNQLEDIKETVNVYPTVDHQYLLKDEVVYHGEEFSAWVEENGFGVYFSGLLKVNHSELKQPLHQNYNSYTASKLLEISKMLSSKIKNHEERAKLIKIFTSDDFKELHASSYKLPLLINDDFKFNEGEYDDKVFGVKELPKGFVPLEYIKVLFINQDFLEALFKVFSTEINEIQHDRKEKGKAKEDKVRTLEGLVRNVVDLGLDDLTQIVEFIVKETNQKLVDHESEVENVVIVKEMVASLYSLYNNTTDRTSVKNIPLLSRANELTSSDKLKFGDDFLPELYTETIFEGVYDDSHYLSNQLIRNLPAEEESKSLVNFFHWLGVNKLITIDHVKDKSCNTGSELEYFNFLFDTKKCEKHDNAKNYNTLLSTSLVKNDGFLNKMKLEQLILLLGKSSFLCKSISLNNDDEEMSKMMYKYGNAYPKPIKIPYSFIYFQIYKIAEFQKYTISEDSDLSVLFQRINLNDDVYNILMPEEKKQVKEVLRRLGTAESIEDISEDYLIDLLKNQDDLDSKDSRKLYEKCMEYYLKTVKLESGITQQSLRFYARKGSEPYQLIDKDNVYYSDNTLLPKNILNKFAFINLPSRIGEDNVKKILGIKLIKDEISNIEVKQLNKNNLSDSLTNEINTLKPFFLAHRLKTIKQIGQRPTEAKYLKELSIQLVTDLTYSFHGKDFQLNTNEFIPIKGVFYLKSNHNSIEDLKHDLDFCDIIAEIVGMIFKISNLNNEFYSIFKAQSIKDVKHGIMRNEMDELLYEAMKYLGISTEQQDFWNKIFPGKGLKDISEENDFKTKLRGLLNEKKLPDSYNQVDFSDFNNEEGIQFLKWIENNFITIKLDHLLPTEGLTSWHRRQLENEFSSFDSDVKKILWLRANKGDIELKKKFFGEYLTYQNAINIDCFDVFLRDNAFKIHPNYKNEILSFCKEKFNIDALNKVDLELEMYHDVLFKKEENIFAPVIDMQKTLKDNDIEVYSLLYFEGDEFEKIIDEKLKEFVQQFKETNIENDKDTGKGVEMTASFGTMLTKTSTSSKNEKVKKTSSVTEKKNRESAKKGLESERKVKKYFKDNNYDFIPISEITDGLHYDFKYKKKEETEWRYLEVKTDSGGYFYLSNGERKTGMNSEYRDRYDIAVVNGNHIQFFIKPFVHDDDSEFKAIPNDFIVYFDTNK